VTYTVDDDDDNDGGGSGDVGDWVGLLSTRVEGRVRRRSLLTDVNVTDWRRTTSTSHALTPTGSVQYCAHGATTPTTCLSNKVKVA